MRVPAIPTAVAWHNGLVLEPSHFRRSDRRSAALAYLAGLVADPWPWGFSSFSMDETALASGQLRIDCEGIFPGGEPFRAKGLVHSIRREGDSNKENVFLSRDRENGALSLLPGDDVPSEDTLPVARLVYHGGVWSALADWSPPTILIDPEHPMRRDINRQLGALAALSAGFIATLRLPGAEDRPAGSMLGHVATALSTGVGVIDALLAAPAVSPGRVGIEALRLALGVRGQVGVYEPLEEAWDPADQRGSIRRLLYAAESAASGIGLPFRANVFRQNDEIGALVVEGLPAQAALLAIEASKPGDLIAARTWLEGAAVAAPDRIHEALTRRVSGCTRHPVERDPQIGISSGSLLALYRVENDVSWRGGQAELALASKTPPPSGTLFSILISEGGGEMGSPPSSGLGQGRFPGSPDWTGLSR